MFRCTYSSPGAPRLGQSILLSISLILTFFHNLVLYLSHSLLSVQLFFKKMKKLARQVFIETKKFKSNFQPKKVTSSSIGESKKRNLAFYKKLSKKRNFSIPLEIVKERFEPTTKFPVKVRDIIPVCYICDTCQLLSLSFRQVTNLFTVFNRLVFEASRDVATRLDVYDAEADVHDPGEDVFAPDAQLLWMMFVYIDGGCHC